MKNIHSFTQKVNFLFSTYKEVRWIISLLYEPQLFKLPIMTYNYVSKNCCRVFFLILLLTSWLLPLHATDPFVPGAGGTMPTVTEFQPIAGQVGGFLVYSSTRHNNWFGSGTYAEVNMSFPDAATYGAETIVLQYRKSDSSWANLLLNEKEITTTGNNFSLELYQSYVLRLLLRGGAKDGYVSNTQSADLALADTYFGNVMLDEGMYLTGVMAPWVGRGLKISYVVNKTSDNSVVDGGLTYQWFRVNPVTYEMTGISGATGLTYNTTSADLGYRLLVAATGDQTTVGGFYQMMSSMNVVSPNKCFVTNQGTGGFTLNLYQDVAKLDTGDLMLRDKDYVKVPIASVVKGSAGGVFQINAALSLDKSPYYLQNTSGFWKICTEMFFGQMSDLMEGVSIDLTANGLGQTSQEATLKLMYKPLAKQIRFESASTVKTVSLYSLSGTLLGNYALDQNEGCVPVGQLNPGLYLIRFNRQDGCIVRKVLVTK